MRSSTGSNILLLALSASLLAGCGYHVGFGLREMGVRTVGIEVVSNKTLRQRLEIPLTQQLQKEMEARIDVLTTAPRNADAVLKVTISGLRERTLAEGAMDVVVVGGMVIGVDYELVRRDTGEVLREGDLKDQEDILLYAGDTFQSSFRALAKKIARRVILHLDPAIEQLTANHSSEKDLLGAKKKRSSK